MIETVLEESARQLAPQDLKIVPRRDRTFTVLELDRQGISNAQETLLWQEIQEFTVTDGTVTLLKKVDVLPQDVLHSIMRNSNDNMETL